MQFLHLIFVVLLYWLTVPTRHVAANNLTQLLNFLRTYQTFACDGDYLTLNCDQRTVISIVVAQYGEAAPSTSSCKAPSRRPIPNRALNQTQVALQKARDMCPEKEVRDLRYAFLRRIELNCREQNRCKLRLTPSELALPNEHDSCSDITKFAEVAFKCRPNTFINKIVCEGSKLKMNCASNDDRIVVLSTFYGAAPSSEGVPECPSARVLNHKTAHCEAPDVTERVISVCQGRRNCTLEANNENLSTPVCSAPLAFHRKAYLKVVYTCISKRMLLREFDAEANIPTINTISSTTATTTTTTSTTTTTEASSTTHLTSQSRLPVSNEPLMDSALGHSSTNEGIKLGGMIVASPDGDHTNCTTLPGSMQVVGFVSNWISAVSFMRKNRELFILYLLVSVFGATICILVTLSGRLYYQKWMAQKRSKNGKHPRPSTRTTAETFDGLDFDDDDNDDIDGGREPEAVDNDMNIMESFSNSNTEDPYSRTPLSARPLIYSTLRKKPATFAQHQVHCPENQLYGYILPQAPSLACSWSAQQRSSLALASLPAPLSPTHYQSLHHQPHPYHHHHHQPHTQHYGQAPKSLPPTTPSALPVISGVRTSGMFDFGPLHIARVASTTTTTEISPNSANITAIDSPPPPPPSVGSASHTNTVMNGSLNDPTTLPLPPEGTSSLIITKV